MNSSLVSALRDPKTALIRFDATGVANDPISAIIPASSIEGFYASRKNPAYFIKTKISDTPLKVSEETYYKVLNAWYSIFGGESKTWKMVG